MQQNGVPIKIKIRHTAEDLSMIWSRPDDSIRDFISRFVSKREHFQHESVEFQFRDCRLNNIDEETRFKDVGIVHQSCIYAYKTYEAPLMISARIRFVIVNDLNYYRNYLISAEKSVSSVLSHFQTTLPVDRTPSKRMTFQFRDKFIYQSDRPFEDCQLQNVPGFGDGALVYVYESLPSPNSLVEETDLG